MTTFDFDLFVVGGGSAGVRAARMAGQRGTRVALAEAGAMGGTCVNVGCIPKKLYSYAAGYAQYFEEAQGYGWSAGESVFDWERLKALRHTLSGSRERTLMKLVVDDASDRVVGLHMVGADAGDIVQGFAVAMKAGATKAVFDSTIGIHPTAAEEFVTMREISRF